MARQYNSDKVRLAFENFADQHKGEEWRTKDINMAVSDMLGGSLDGWCVSDFAEPETLALRSKYNKTLFERIKRGRYKVL